MPPSPRRTALVTGANRGIGAAIARQLASRGDFVVLAAGRDQAAADDAARLAGSGAEGVILDLSNESDTASDLDAIRHRHPSIDVLINNAGVLEREALLDLDPTQIDRSLRVNLMAPMQLIRAIVPGMSRHGYGRIVNLSSGWGAFSEGLGGPAAYAISKAALNALTVVAAREAPVSVKINACCPGWVKTRMGGDAAPRTPDEGADTPVWLATLPDSGPTGGFFRNRKKITW